MKSLRIEIHTSTVAPVDSHSNLHVDDSIGGVSNATSTLSGLFGTILNSCCTSFPSQRPDDPSKTVRRIA